MPKLRHNRISSSSSSTGLTHSTSHCASRTNLIKQERLSCLLFRDELPASVGSQQIHFRQFFQSELDLTVEWFAGCSAVGIGAAIFSSPRRPDYPTFSEASTRPTFEMDVRLWQVECALAARKLLSLGCAYQVRYSMPRDAVDLLTFRDFGLDVAAVVNSHVFQVTPTRGEPPRFPMEFRDEVDGRATDNCSIFCVEAGDYLVGIGVEDFFVCPRTLQQVEQDMAAVGAEVNNELEQRETKKMVVFHFVRLEGLVRDDLRLRTPGSILRILDEVDAECMQLLTRYELLVGQERLVLGGLQSVKDLITYVKVSSHDTRKLLMEDQKFQFAAKFREWYAAITSEGEQDTTNDNGSESVVAETSSNNSPAPTSILRRNSSLSVPRNVPKKRVTFTADVKDPAPMSSPPTRSDVSKASTPKRSGVEESRAYLLALVSPNTNIVESLQKIAATALSKRMDQEFRVAAGVKLQSKIRHTGPSEYSARVRFGPLSFDVSASRDRNAASDALRRVTQTVVEHQKLYGEMLEYLKSEFGFCKDNCSREVKGAVFSYLTEKNIVKLQKRASGDPDNIIYDVVATIQRVSLARKRGSSLLSTKSDVADAFMQFLMELIDQHEKSVEQTDTFQQERTSSHSRVDDHSEEVDYGKSENLQGRTSIIDESGDPRTAEEFRPIRKRPYVRNIDENYEDERAAPRPRVSNRTVEPELKAAAAEETIMFVEDRSGSHPRRAAPPRPEDEEGKAKADIYQKLLRLLFLDREKVVRTVEGIAWDLSAKSERISLPSGFSICRTAMRKDNGVVSCELTVTEDVIEKVCGTGASYAEAQDEATSKLIYRLNQLVQTWERFLATYNAQLQEKTRRAKRLSEKQMRGKKLEAGNETQARNRDKVSTSFKCIPPNHACFVLVRGKIVIFSACLNTKDAKRAANEDWRDTLEDLNKIKARTRAAASNPPRPTQATRKSHLVVCSDDETDEENWNLSDEGSDNGGP
ncbi:hypothetical protein PF006_g15703 [Phytophthora fragariae]|uniref:TFIIS central domain-containing protein n=2 Tax=Phytophthora fragariae TaxID=53985 RepID=A0A6A3EIQ1_9STRA|nr:hypothetical protein PF009_g17767 [Phytophthora fragariae]KAE9130688.1 hypothetical protein PF006_g15703 [Phytophthora fragariae]